jgi:hypothetical protein
MGAEDTGLTGEWKEFSELNIPCGAGTSTLIGKFRLVRNTSAFEVKPLLLSRDRGAREKRSGSPAASVAKYGKGQIACVYGPVFNDYGLAHYFGIRELIGDTIKALEIPDLCKADLPSGIHMTLRKKDNRILVSFVNLRNLKPLSGRSSMVDEIPATGPVHFEMKLPEYPEAIYLAPSGAPVEWTHINGMLKVSAPLVGIHDILVIERKTTDE